MQTAIRNASIPRQRSDVKIKSLTVLHLFFQIRFRPSFNILFGIHSKATHLISASNAIAGISKPASFTQYYGSLHASNSSFLRWLHPPGDRDCAGFSSIQSRPWHPARRCCIRSLRTYGRGSAAAADIPGDGPGGLHKFPPAVPMSSRSGSDML